MSQKDDAGVESGRLSLSAAYRQLDDHLGPHEAPYVVGSGLERLLDWMNDEAPTVRAGSYAEHLETERLVRDHELINLRMRAIERTVSVRMRSSLIATCTVAFFSLLTGVGLFFGLSRVPPHAAVPLVVTVGVIDALVAFAVGYMHRTTMKGLQADLQLSFGTRAEPHEDGGREGGKVAGPTPQPQASVPRVELVPSRSRFSLLSLLAAIVAGAYAAASLLSHTTRSWIPLAVAGVVLVLFLTLFVAVVIPAVWSGAAFRRDSAQRVLYAMLGLTMRSEAQRRVTKRKDRA